MAATKKRIANSKIVLHRKGVGRIVIKANQSFEFTPEELESLKLQDPDCVRTPINEDEDAVEVKAKPAKGADAQTGSGKKGGAAKGDGAGGDGTGNDDPL